MNDDRKENLIYKKKFDKLGLNVIYFIIEEKLNDLSFIFSDCLSLKKIKFINPQTEEITRMFGMFNECIEIE